MRHWARLLDRLFSGKPLVGRYRPLDQMAEEPEIAEQLVAKKPLLCYRGMSGISHATLLAAELERLHLDFGMVYARKENEDSHAASYRSVEVAPKAIYDSDTKRFAPTLFRDYTLVFVDDFVCSGQTRNLALRPILGSTERTDLAMLMMLSVTCNRTEFHGLRFLEGLGWRSSGPLGAWNQKDLNGGPDD